MLEGRKGEYDECVKAEVDAIYAVDMTCLRVSMGTINFICDCKYIKVIYTDDDTRLFYDSIYEMRRKFCDADWEDIRAEICEIKDLNKKADIGEILRIFKRLHDASGFARRFVIG
jgi:hypothetical protein